METFVLIAGAWHGGWSRRPVATALRAAGHRVLTPTDCCDVVVDRVEREDRNPFSALDVPSADVLSTGDVAFPPGEYGWDRFPTRLPGAPLVETPGSHEADVTRSGEPAEAFLRVVS